MTPELKKTLIKRFLEEASPVPVVIDPDSVEGLSKYDEFAAVLDALERSHDRLIDFAQVNTDLAKWNCLKAILASGLVLTTSGPGVQSVNLAAMQKAADKFILDALPQPDYYHRTTQPDAATQGGALGTLIGQSSTKLAGLLADITPPGFDERRKADISALVVQIKAEIQRATTARDNTALAKAKNQLVIAEDLLKINQLQAIIIPGEHGAGAQRYCVLAEAAGGVTEKVSLISLAKATAQLTNIRDNPIVDVDAYMAARANYKLSTGAILKLPKHGKIEEVQREATALNISRLLGLDTTESSIVTHAGKPALFVPFGDIRLMSDFAKGKTLSAGGFSSKTYEHYSTINPVGEGLQGDLFVDDFGSALGLFYLCSDPDSMGGYNQNKALRDSRSLYIFDQVVMPSDGFKLDSRISLQPTGMMGHSRHGQGRNRTLLEDSTMESKFESMIQLLHEGERIDKYLARTIEQYTTEIARIDHAISQRPDPAQLKLLKEEREPFVVLKKDAEALRVAVKRRIDAIVPTFPALGAGLPKEVGCQALVLEKLLHNPRLYTDEGRPYKNPWTYRQSNHATRVEQLESGRLRITFSDTVPAEMASFIKRSGISSLSKTSAKQLEISPQDLARLNEGLLHPEQTPRLNHGQNYLEAAALQEISKAYKEGHRTRITSLIDGYRTYMRDDSHSPAEKIAKMDETRIFLQRYIDTAKDKGYGMHVMKKLQFDMQQQLQAMIPALDKPANLDAAFEAALQLDRVEQFNKVLACAIKNNKVDSLAFRTFLQDCIDERAHALNHSQAVLASSAVEQAGNRAMMVLNLSLVLPQPQAIAIEDLDEIDPVEQRQTELAEQRSSLDYISPPTPVLVSVTPELGSGHQETLNI